MCGLAGVISRESERFAPHLARSMLKSLRHRGPDDQGILLFSPERTYLGRDIPANAEGTALLIHTRLAIIDLAETGWQPMASPDGRFYIVFNGEIYNYLELRKELAELGHPFRSRSDTEVLLAAYQKWGSKALQRLTGMFAFAILDTHGRSLFLARDPFGIKPLYYGVGSGRFAFASEPRVLLALPWISRGVDAERAYRYLRHGTTDCGSKTLFADIQQLPPGHYLDVRPDQVAEPRPLAYWDLECDRDLELSFDEAAAQLRDMFLKNVELHLRSDVPVGATLSGGIDSSAIVMAMRLIQGQRLDLHTFSFIPDDPRLSEEPWIDLITRVAQAQVHKIRPTREHLLADVDHLIWLQGEPFGSTSIYAQHCVFAQVRSAGIKVTLGGQGADEMLGGYRIYLAARMLSLIRRGQWWEAGRFLRKALRQPGVELKTILLNAGAILPGPVQLAAGSLLERRFMPPWLDAAWFARRGVDPRPRRKRVSPRALREKLAVALRETSLPMLLRYEDRNSMGFSVENRVPFLTPALAGFVLSLPEDYIIAADGTSKSVFRKALVGIVPDRILERRDKIGFATPERDWLGSSSDWVAGVLSQRRVARVRPLSPTGLQDEWSRIRSRRGRFDSRVWQWVNFVRWCELFDVTFE